VDLQRVDCPICQVDDARRLFAARDLDVFGPGEFPVIECRRCGLAYLNPRPTPEAMARYYPRHYWGPAATETPETELDASTRLAFDCIVREYPGGRLLDVGCGVGAKTAALRSRGLRVVGLEPYEVAAQQARERFGLEIVSQTLVQADLSEGSFDVVTLFEVLEHLHDPMGDLRRIRALLRPRGAVVVRVPNFAALQARLFGRWWYALQTPRHLWHFTARSVRKILDACGFRDITCASAADWRTGSWGFQASTLYWLRGRHLARKGVEIAPEEGQTTGEALEGHVYVGVPSTAKRLFRWLVRYVVYLPVGVENLLGRGFGLFAIGRR
jgi:SAM-dependent methyltransferase